VILAEEKPTADYDMMYKSILSARCEKWGNFFQGLANLV